MREPTFVGFLPSAAFNTINLLYGKYIMKKNKSNKKYNGGLTIAEITEKRKKIHLQIQEYTEQIRTNNLEMDKLNDEIKNIHDSNNKLESEIKSLNIELSNTRRKFTMRRDKSISKKNTEKKKTMFEEEEWTKHSLEKDTDEEERHPHKLRDGRREK